MSINENEKNELFNEFYDWLKADGLKPKSSERLHRKKIYEGLMHDDKRTIDNFIDFIEDRKIRIIKELEYQTIIYQDIELTINQVFIEKEKNEFVLKTDQLDIRCQFSKINEILALVKKFS